MQKTYWAKRGKIKVGPCGSHEAVLNLFRETYPFPGPDWQARSKKMAILTGYGIGGPNFDMRWHHAKQVVGVDD